MKKFSFWIVALLLFFSATSCDAFRSLSRGDASTSLGKPYELVLVCNQHEWDGALGDILRGLFRAPVGYVNQQEPLFDLLRVPERGFTKMVVRHRNILKVSINPSLEQTSAKALYDVQAQPQIVVTLQGPSATALIEYLNEHGRELVSIFELAERERAVAYAARFNQEHIGAVIRRTFGFDFTVPKGYELAKEEPDFLWCRYEYPAASQGFCIYSYPYQGKGSLNERSLLAARNRFVKRIPGPSDGSYMTTSDAFEPDVRAFRLNERPWIEMRGFWDVAGDFMGGPFVSYTTVDTATGRVITIDCYVYSPNLEKRNFLRGVEHLLYMITFPPQKAE